MHIDCKNNMANNILSKTEYNRLLKQGRPRSKKHRLSFSKKTYNFTQRLFDDRLCLFAPKNRTKNDKLSLERIHTRTHRFHSGDEIILWHINHNDQYYSSCDEELLYVYNLSMDELLFLKLRHGTKNSDITNILRIIHPTFDIGSL